MSRKGFAAALLLAALSARAQVEIRPTLGAPSAPGVMALPAALPLAPAPTPFAAHGAPSAPLTAAPVLAAAPSAVAALAPAALPAAAPAAPVLPPAQAHAATLGAALADFGRVDLNSASAGDARGAGETLMLRALGAAADGPTAVPAGSEGFSVPGLAPAARPAAPRTYMLSVPLRVTVKLGPASLAGHVLYEAAVLGFKAWLVWKATHSPTAAGAAVAFELATSSPMWVPFRTVLDLGQRYWRRKLSVLRELARTPGIDRIRVLTTGKVRFFGPFAWRKDNTGLIFVEASSALPAEVGRFGAPIPIEDVDVQHVRLTLAAPGVAAAAAWSPSLGYLLEGHPLPPEVSAAWRAALSAGKAPIKILLDAAKSASLRIDATLVGPDGTEKTLGSIAEGPAVKTLIGMGHLDRVRGWLRWRRATRKLPVSDTRVERPGDPRAAGWRAALRRAWLRISGRLIVARS